MYQHKRKLVETALILGQGGARSENDSANDNRTLTEESTFSKKDWRLQHVWSLSSPMCEFKEYVIAVPRGSSQGNVVDDELAKRQPVLVRWCPVNHNTPRWFSFPSLFHFSSSLSRVFILSFTRLAWRIRHYIHFFSLFLSLFAAWSIREDSGRESAEYRKIQQAVSVDDHRDVVTSTKQLNTFIHRERERQTRSSSLFSFPGSQRRRRRFNLFYYFVFFFFVPPISQTRTSRVFRECLSRNVYTKS
jgi:hypothetical protein